MTSNHFIDLDLDIIYYLHIVIHVGFSQAEQRVTITLKWHQSKSKIKYTKI